MNEDLYDIANFILIYQGKYEAFNVIRVAILFEDDKLRIMGLLPLQLQPSSDIDILYIMLKTRLSPEEPSQVFGIPKTTSEDETLVYLWKKAPLYERTGRWQIYLKQLKAKLEQENNKILNLNRTPIDDTQFFPDVTSDQST